MNVASLELCKELYELSGWESQHTHWDDTPLSKWKPGVGKVCPAYDLGYLLRKIPEFDDKEYCVRKYEGKWQIWEHEEGWYDENGNHVYFDTPEDAAASLAIELFKQGVLK